MAVQSKRHPAAQVRQDAAAAGRVTGDAVAAGGATPAFVGREHELAALTDALRRRRALMVIEGEPGIGKTRLVHEVLASVADRTVLLATCPPLAEPFPLGPVVDGIRRLRPETAKAGLSPVGGALRPLFPEWADQLPPPLEALDSARETRHRLLRALTELLERLAVEVLVVEDAHWADTATLELLLTLAAAGEQGGPSLVVTYRPTEVPEGSLLLRLTSRAPAGMSRTRIELGPLAVAETRLLVGSMFGTDEVSEEFAAFLHERTDGVPLSVEECLQLLRARHDIVRHRGRWTRRLLDELEVPPTVRDSVLERVARLTTEVRRVLEAAAVLAAPAEESLLGEVAELPEQAGRESVAAALASGLLREASLGRFGFRHALDAQAVGEAIPASRWRGLHGLAARALRKREPDAVERLSRHCREAGETEAWCVCAEASADLAVQAGDDRNAVTQLLQLLTAIEHPIERRARLARKLGEAAFFGATALGSLADRVVAVLRDVLERDEVPQSDRGELRLLLGRMLWEIGDGVAAFHAIESAVPDLGHRPGLALRAMTNLALPLIPEWAVERHLYWLNRAAEAAKLEASSPESRAFARIRASALLFLGDESGWEAIADVPGSASGPREQRQVAGALLNVALAAMVWGRFDVARRQLDAVVDLVEKCGYQRLMTGVGTARGQLDWYRGRWHGLDDVAGKLAVDEDIDPIDRLQARQIVGLLRLVAGRRATAERQLREVAEQYMRLQVAEPMSMLSVAGLGRLLLADGDATGVLKYTGPAIDMVTRKEMWLWATDVAPVHVDALIATDQREEADLLVRSFAASLGPMNAPAPQAALLTCRAIVAEAAGDTDDAADLCAAAATAWAALPRPYDELLATERRGRCLLVAGHREQALAVLAGVEQRLTDLGARWDADRLAQLLRRHGVEVSRAWRRGPRGYGERLSPREGEVLSLIAQGMTNREVGQVLFLSPKTVGRHLSNAMSKLRVTTRTAAAMAAVEAGLIAGDHDVPVP